MIFRKNKNKPKKPVMGRLEYVRLTSSKPVAKRFNAALIVPVLLILGYKLSKTETFENIVSEYRVIIGCFILASPIPILIFSYLKFYRPGHDYPVEYDGDMVFLNTPKGSFGFNRNEISLILWQEFSYTSPLFGDDESMINYYAYQMKIFSPSGVIEMTTPYDTIRGFYRCGLSKIFQFIVGERAFELNVRQRTPALIMPAASMIKKDDTIVINCLAKDFYCGDISHKKFPLLGSAILRVSFYCEKTVLQFSNVCLILRYKNISKAYVINGTNESRLAIKLKSNNFYEFLLQETKDKNGKINLDNAMRIAAEITNMIYKNQKKHAVDLSKNT